MGLTSVDEDTDDVLVEIVLALLWEKLLGVPRPDENKANNNNKQQQQIDIVDEQTLWAGT